MAKNTKVSNTETKKKFPFNVFSKKGLAALALAGVMVASPLMLAGCSNGQDGKDGSDGTIWKSGTSYTQFTDAKVGDYFIDTDDYILYQKSADAWTIVMENYGRPGSNGITANNIEMAVNNGNIQWRYKTGTDTEWKTLLAVSTLNGANGYTPYIQDGYWYINNESTGVKAEGTTGSAGKEIEIQNNGTSIQWKYEDDAEWTDLVALSALKGQNGTNGENGKSVKIAVNEGNIQWRYTDDSNEWQTIIALDTLKGSNGTDGTTPHIDTTTGNWFIGTTDTGYKAAGVDGREIKLQVTADYIQWQYEDDVEWTNLIPLSSLKGADGKDGATWHSSTGIPANTLGTNGDFYLDESTYDIYKNTDGTWAKIGTLSATTNNITTNKLSPWYGKSAVFVGDSITAGSGATSGNRYWELLEDYLQLGEVTDMGIGGSCISVTSNYGTQYNPLSTRYDNIPEADLIQIFMGTNDYGHDTPLGTIEDTTDISFYGALNVIIPALQTKYPTSRIVFVTPLHRYGANNLNFDYEENGAGNTLKDYVDAIKDVCERYSVPVIDLFSISGINPSITDVKNTYMPDGIHPNDAGHKLIASLMSNYLELFATTQTEIQEDTEEPNIKEWNEVGLTMSNTYAQAGTVLQNRISATQNIYLEAGQKISLTDTATYKYFLYEQADSTPTLVESADRTALMSSWTTKDYFVAQDGWYGVCIAKNDDSNFDSSSLELQTLEDYFTIDTENNTENGDISQFSMVLGHKYSTSGGTLNTRITINKNIFLTAGTTISLTNTSEYKIAVYTQNGETYEYYTTSGVATSGVDIITDGYQTATVTIDKDGYYGIVIAKTDDANFDFTTDSENASSYITLTTSN